MRALAWMLIGMVATLMMLAMAGVYVARSSWGRQRVKRVIERSVDERLDGTLHLEQVGGDLTSQLVLDGVELRDREGHTVVRIKHLSARYRLGDLARHRLVLDEIAIDGAEVHLQRGREGRWNLPAMFDSLPAGTSDSPWRVLIGKGRAQGHVTVQEGRIELPIQVAIRLHGEPHSDRLSLEEAVLSAPGVRLTAQGTWAPHSDFALTAELVGTDLSQIGALVSRTASDGWQGLRGQVKGQGRLARNRGRLRGEIDLEGEGVQAGPVRSSAVHLHLQYDGESQLRGKLRLSVPSWPTPYGRWGALRLDARLEPDRLWIDGFTAASGRGQITGRGEARIEDGGLNRMELRAEAEHFSVITPAGAVEVEARLRLTLVHTGDGYAGTLRVAEGKLRLPDQWGHRALQPLGSLEDLLFVGQSPSPVVAHPDRHIAVAIAFGDPLLVHTREFEARIGGSLELTAPQGRGFSLVGTLESLSGGWADLLGRRFTIERARLDFAGERPINPGIDIRLVRHLHEADLWVGLFGTLRAPQLELSSEPPRYDRAELVSLLVSGEPNRPVSEGSLDSAAVASLPGLIVSALKEQLLPGLPIDVLRVESSAEGFSTTRVEVGKYLSSRIYLSYTHQFGVANPLGPQNSNQATIEWRFARQLRLDTTFGDAGIGSADLYFTLRR